MMIYRVAAACCLGLEVAEHTFWHGLGLPLGGNQLTQLGLVFALAFVFVEAREGMASAWHWVRRSVRSSLRQWRS